ncbi:hypothetical protein [Streptomyces sp. NPDC006285]|uniref:hypothetical protein n=1 Tax=Streptomyces sp. NPDC006285 TaxID=3364742 RepID=UPI0036BE7116
MNVTRIHTDGGSHIDPELDQTWPEDKKLDWHASVVMADTGLHIELYPIRTPGEPTRYGINIGDFRKGGVVSTGGGTYRDAWDYLNGVSTGARALLRKQQHDKEQAT